MMSSWVCFVGQARGWLYFDRGGGGFCLGV
jgi:hypothetical protein